MGEVFGNLSAIPFVASAGSDISARPRSLYFPGRNTTAGILGGVLLASVYTGCFVINGPPAVS